MTEASFLRRLLIKNLTLQGAAEAVALASGLLVTLVLSRQLGVAGFGQFNYLFAFLYFFLAVNDLGVNTIVVREISRAPDRAGEIIGTMLSFRLLLAVVSTLVAWAVIGVVGYPPALRVSLAVFALVLPLNALRLPGAIFQARLRFEYGATVEIVTRVATAACVVFAVWRGAGLPGVTVALVAAEAMGMAVGLLLSARLVTPVWRFSPAAWMTVLRSSVPLGLAGMLVAITNRIDFIMLERLAGLEQVGLYGAAYKVTGLLERFPQLVMITLYPVMAEVAGRDLAGLRAIYRKSVVGLGGLGLLVTALVWWLSPEILRLFGTDYVTAARGLRVLVCSTLCIYIALTGGHLLVAVGWERVSLAAWIVGAAMNVGLNFLWIPTMGYTGAALATLTAYAFVLLVTLVAVELYLKRPAGTSPGAGRVRHDSDPLGAGIVPPS